MKRLVGLGVIAANDINVGRTMANRSIVRQNDRAAQTAG